MSIYPYTYKAFFLPVQTQLRFYFCFVFHLGMQKEVGTMFGNERDQSKVRPKVP